MIAIEKFSVRNAVSRHMALLSQAASNLISQGVAVADGSLDRRATRPVTLRKTSLADDAAKLDLLCGRSNYAKGIIMSH